MCVCVLVFYFILLNSQYLRVAMNDKMIHEQEAQKYFDFAVAYLNLPEGTKKKKKNHDKAVTIADLSRD
jgi:hypothetical protein